MGLFSKLGSKLENKVKELVDEVLDTKRDVSTELVDWLSCLPSPTPEQQAVQRHLRAYVRERPDWWDPKNTCTGWFLSPHEVGEALQLMARVIEPNTPRNTIWNRFVVRAHKRMRQEPRHPYHGQPLDRQLVLGTKALHSAVAVADQFFDDLPRRISSVEGVIRDEDLCGLGMTTFAVALDKKVRDLQRAPPPMMEDLKTLLDALYPACELARVFQDVETASRDETDASRLSRHVSERVRLIQDKVDRLERI